MKSNKLLALPITWMQLTNMFTERSQKGELRTECFHLHEGQKQRKLIDVDNKMATF